ncbi:MBL fold metallo-hydrolase [Mesobacillus subterraneus]|uniref:MBL fold metallo-hydrolase n=1 Tax=Mesobacillus subterraneus TaxID=285983 RepID=A0A427TUQ8_9BACI|nr:MBL fold metallo-hydrolase [Mesobacillus subterraneus]RSD28194.1 MBL fold metallo-hydrolase [Mesobacillus subterraneus]
MKKPVQLSEKLFLIDDYDLSIAERTGTYLLMEDELTLIETSASPSIPHILDGLKSMNVTPADIQYIIVTHIHLDHAGGTGLMLQKCPNAKVVVHPKGARHLADPSRLIQGAKAVYGEKFDQLFDPIIPIPEGRLVVKGDGDSLEISHGLKLEFLDTPGHANHHFSIYHPALKGVFTGDTAGIFYPQLYREGIEFYLPSTSPNQFDPEKMRHSIGRYKDLGIERIFFGHYGMSENPAAVFKQVEEWLEVFLEEAKLAVSQEIHPDQQVQEITRTIYGKIKAHLTEQGLNENHPIYELLHLDINVSAMGLAHYFQKKNGGSR